MVNGLNEILNLRLNSVKNRYQYIENKNGEIIMNVKFCQECGTKLTEGAKFCPECGTKIIPQGNQADTEEELDWALRNCDSTCAEYKKAFAIINKYAENGNAEAQYTLGLCYANGDVVPQDFKKAYYWHNKAADQGHKDAIWEIEHWDFD